MTTIKGKWQKLLEAEILQRSSQVLSVVNQTAYIFGGELRPREPRDNDVHILSFAREPSLSTIRSTPSSSSSTSRDEVPSARVGSASATLNSKIYLFSGRGGVDMSPIEEKGALWEFDTASNKWSLITPSLSSAEYPPARSYHTTASNPNTNTVYVHAGCPTSGRLSDLWSFNLNTKTWTQLAPAPDPPRGGTSLTFLNGKLYRLNGFDGKNEQGGSLDVYDIGSNTWSSIKYAPDGQSGPEARSVSALLPVRISGAGQEGGYLVTLFGERDPSSLGHQGAGKMLSDVWAFDVAAEVWRKVDAHVDAAEGQEGPKARGWFAADVVDDKRSILVHGGLGESNERLGDVWLLRL